MVDKDICINVFIAVLNVNRIQYLLNLFGTLN
jgi:hypothetical protein